MAHSQDANKIAQDPESQADPALLHRDLRKGDPGLFIGCEPGGEGGPGCWSPTWGLLCSPQGRLSQE